MLNSLLLLKSSLRKWIKIFKITNMLNGYVECNAPFNLGNDSQNYPVMLDSMQGLCGYSV